MRGGAAFVPMYARFRLMGRTPPVFYAKLARYSGHLNLLKMDYNLILLEFFTPLYRYKKVRQTGHKDSAQI